jgi:hypothetical protein
MRLSATLAAMAFLLLSSSLAYADEWTMADTVREATYLALHVADWSQSHYIADHPSEYHETNPILGRHPSSDNVNIYFAATALIHPLISYVLPSPYRQWWQYITIGVEAVTVGNNARLGIGFSW